jgi:alpha-glucosidase (family GH31 glycosyl hydrolase)
MATTDEKEVQHSVPCTQKDNIAHLHKKMDRLYEIIEGNGKPGMKTDLALVVDHVTEIKSRLSSTMEVNNELEVQRRVAFEVSKIEQRDKEEKEKKRNSLIKKAEIFVAFTGGSTGIILLIREIWKILN